VAAGRKSDNLTCGDGARDWSGDATGSVRDLRLCPAGSCFILARSAGGEGLEVRFSRRRGITVVTPRSGYLVFLPFHLTPS
jgi:hypothetical protein